MESDGKFVAEGRYDILVEAIGRPEQCGRVRAAGKGLELNYILEFQNDSHRPPSKRAKLK